MDITENMKRQYKLILDFSSPEEEKRWEIMTDEVMCRGYSKLPREG